MLKPKIFVTGAGGFLNSRMINRWKSDYDMIPMNRKKMNLNDYEGLRKYFDSIKPHIVIHGGAMSATQECEDNPDLAYKVNVTGTVNIARAAKASGAKLIFFSTEQVFNGNVDDGPYREDDTALPSTVYGKTKLEAERLLALETDQYWILRLSWMFGLPERLVPNNPNLLWNLLRAITTNTQISISNNEFRGITHVYDLIDNLQNILNLPFDTYHFGSQNHLSTYDTAVFMLEHMGLSKNRINEIVIKDELKHKNNKRDLTMSYEKIRSLGININTSQDSIRGALEQFRFIVK
jgi:dTDP-4-dehydrorhamnose reductase